MESDNEFNIKDFISKQKSYLIAPAGYGKTHTIAECLKSTKGKQLILTHTHAGVASIKEKIKKLNIPNKNYNVETISSYAQKYVFAFCKNELPEQDKENYFNVIIDKAIKLLKIKLISNIVKLTYNGLFVDEYQDCTQIQHKFIMVLSDILPTHILGDPLQGIFGFKDDPLVNLENPNEMGEFLINKLALIKPWRWEKGNKTLGNSLKKIRERLYLNEKIILNDYINSIEVEIVNEDDKYDNTKLYCEKLRTLKNENSLLIIHPDSENINSRIKLVKTFHFFKLLDAIDDRIYYDISKKTDKINSKNINQIILKIFPKFFSKKGIDIWFNQKGVRNKRNDKEKETIEPIKTLFDNLKENYNLLSFLNILKSVKNLKNIFCYRIELYNAICKSLEIAHFKRSTVQDAMIDLRNITRRIGRKVYGRYIGTTLLTKGLEFDTVVILDAHKFKDKKNFYVAITRACKKLIIFTEDLELNFNNE
jgi:superfamily I DNA/RNA helicase